MKCWYGLPYLRKRQLRKIMKDVRTYTASLGYERRACDDVADSAGYSITPGERRARRLARARRVGIAPNEYDPGEEDDSQYGQEILDYIYEDETSTSDLSLIHI